MRTAVLLAVLAFTAPARAEVAQSVATGGRCVCSEGGKSWACRKAADYSQSIQCNANLNLVLKCPADPEATCAYVNQPTCTEPRFISVCFIGDKPN